LASRIEVKGSGYHENNSYLVAARLDQLGARNTQHLVAIDDLDALAALWFAKGLFVVVKVVPTVEVCVLNASSV
jgi:hypothetical protein